MCVCVVGDKVVVLKKENKKQVPSEIWEEEVDEKEFSEFLTVHISEVTFAEIETERESNLQASYIAYTLLRLTYWGKNSYNM